jgi:hypothetical protein
MLLFRKCFGFISAFFRENLIKSEKREPICFLESLKQYLFFFGGKSRTFEWDRN